MQALYIPRKKYLFPQDEIDNCPDCNTPLIAEQSSTMLYGKSDIDEGQFVTNRSGSHFCPNCPVVVFEKETIEETLSFSLKIKKALSYDVLALVDFDKIPESKSQLQLGTDENPYPLVPFLNGLDIEQIQPKTFEDKKIGRNAPCPCGSGKKYKKCCL